MRDLGKSTDPRIDFFWTGEKVISDGYSAEHLVDVASDLGRKPFIWDNYISNDSKIRTNHLFLDPSAGSWSLPLDRATGIAINPMNQPYLSRIALCGYRQLLRQEARTRLVFPEICRRLCGMSVAERLLADIDLFQGTGLAKLDADTRSRLLDWYQTETTNPYAQEIVTWLRGDFVFDPQCLTT
jgi:hyaluronoglucosaminidase